MFMNKKVSTNMIAFTNISLLNCQNKYRNKQKIFLHVSADSRMLNKFEINVIEYFRLY